MMYRKVQEGEPMYRFIEASKKAGRWICDSYDHNEDSGCSNPECFKFKGKKDDSQAANRSS